MPWSVTVGNLAAAATSRVWLVLEDWRPIGLGTRRMLTPTIEFGVRRDGGDAEIGTGVELDGSLGYADAARGLSVVGRAVAGQRRSRRKRSGRLSGNMSEIPHLGGNLLVKHTLARGFGLELAR